MSFRHENPEIGAATLDLSYAIPSLRKSGVDDTREIRRFLTEVFHDFGYRAIEGENGLAAQLALMAKHPSLVISDFEMPIGDDWGVVVVTFCHEYRPDTPVMIVTGVWGKRPEIRSWAAGEQTRPFSLARLRTEVLRLFSRTV